MWGTIKAWWNGIERTRAIAAAFFTVVTCAALWMAVNICLILASTQLQGGVIDGYFPGFALSIHLDDRQDVVDFSPLIFALLWVALVVAFETRVSDFLSRQLGKSGLQWIHPNIANRVVAFAFVLVVIVLLHTFTIQEVEGRKMAAGLGIVGWLGDPTHVNKYALLFVIACVFVVRIVCWLRVGVGPSRSYKPVQGGRDDDSRDSAAPPALTTKSS